MTRIRVQLEVLAVAVVLVLLLGATVSRTLAMADRTQARSFATTGAHFVAGIEMVQAESRLRTAPQVELRGLSHRSSPARC